MAGDVDKMGDVSLVGLVATSTRVSFKSLAPTRSTADADWSSASDESKGQIDSKKLLNLLLFEHLILRV